MWTFYGTKQRKWRSFRTCSPIVSDGHIAGGSPVLRALIVCISGLLCIAGAHAAERINYCSGGLTLAGYLCLLVGPGPFSAVVYNHGGVGDRVGGAPRETCEVLATAGYIGFSPIRRATRSLDGHGDDIRAALARLQQVASVDASRIAMIGFSRGALLTYQAAIETPSLKAPVFMPTAVPPRQFARSMGKPADIAMPLLFLVAENDTGSRTTKGRNTLNRHFPCDLHDQHDCTKSSRFLKSCFLQSLDTALTR